MAEQRHGANTCPPNGSVFKEAVCIDAGRIYDSCSDKDCLEDLQVYFTDVTQLIIDQSIGVKNKRVDILNVYLEVEPVPFNKGFYSVDITFFFKVTLEAFTSPIANPTTCTGISVFSKKVILYGSEGNVKTFNSSDPRECRGKITSNMPKASLQVVEPMCLSCKLVDSREFDCNQTVNLPDSICSQFDGEFGCCRPTKHVVITLGLFTIVQLERSVQMMIPAYDFCIPEKDCSNGGGGSDNPCEIFKKIKFPVNEFFPPKLDEDDCSC